MNDKSKLDITECLKVLLEVVISILIVISVYYVISEFWEFLEIIISGSNQVTPIDTVITIIFSIIISVFLNTYIKYKLLLKKFDRIMSENIYMYALLNELYSKTEATDDSSNDNN